MPISHKHKCIFVHIPKTSGTSLEAALGMHGDVDFVGTAPYVNQYPNFDCLFGKGLQHWTALQIKNEIKNYDDYFKFTFVRNPWDRAVSAIIFNGGFDKNLDLNLTKMEFKERIHTLDMTTPHFKPQLDYITDRDTLLVDFIGRFENLVKDTKRISEKISFDIPLKHLMKSKHKHYTEYYDDEARAIVAELYAKDIEYFGYKFDEL
jgi:chondroitin 4-sulfotransferase 11